ncbi:MAG: T9SS type A sorting domain-containing protein [Cyclobacteriaceae bacterium]|nr:T9SS type A sorting domain-containing protein [Cyclobacteriaceae bacterium]
MRLFFIFCLLSAFRVAIAQTTTVSSGNWNDASVWSPATVPTANTNVDVTIPVVLNQNITIGTGDYFFFQNVTDLPGGTNYTLTANTAGGILDIKAGTTTFGGAATFSNSTIIVRNGATLILGATNINNGTTLLIEAGGTLIVNGTLTNSNSGGSFTINGLVQVNGDYDSNNGNLDVTGSGDIFTTGTIFNQGSSTVFGTNNDCGAGPCSGRNLCSFSNTISASQVLCSGTSPAALSGNAVGSPVYSWESSTTSSSSGFALASGTNNTQNYTPGVLTQTTYFRRKVTSGGCTGISPPVTVAVLPLAGGWKGTTTNWNLNTNWCNNTVPTSTTDVTISTGVPNFPQITAAANCRDLLINTGASVTINASNTLSIFGNLTNNGTLTTNTSTVTLSGSSQQTASGNAINFNNLTINNSSGSSPQVVINSFLTIQGTLTMTAGNVNLSGYNLTLGLDAGTTGTLSYTNGRLFNGDFTRWVSTPVIPDLSVRGLFPMGTSSDKRLLYVSYPSTAPTTLGTIRVGHTGATTTSVVSVTDGGTIVRRQDSFWKVATGNGLAGGTINLRAGGTGFGTVGALTDLRIMLATAAAPGSNATATGSFTDFLTIRTGLSAATLSGNFYIGSINATQSPLPIKLLSFKATPLQGGVSLDWVTSSEKDFDYFQVERASDDLQFKPLGRVVAKGGLNIETHYDFFDSKPLNGKNYYRLKNIDFDGSFDYSPVVYVDWQSSSDIVLYPNPITNREFMLELDGEVTPGTSISVLNTVGLEIMQRKVLQSEELISLPDDTKAGIYFVKIQRQESSRTIKVVVK